ncbi:MAG: hypothetical protein KY455_09315 [Euryarchaeota archaeon]|nr:hypothetical protein [Euryarchaeota archaeon]
MVSLPFFKLDEKRLWQAIGIVLGVSLVLIFAAVQSSWWTASFYPDNTQEARGEFSFDGRDLQLYRNGEEAACPLVVCGERPYTDGSALGTVMDRTEMFVTLGLIGLVIYVGMLLGLYHGKLHNTRLVLGTGFASLAALLVGLFWFTFTVGEAGVQEVERVFDAYAAQSGGVPRPEPKFWGTQDIAGNELETAPGLGWLFAILGALNLALGTVLLYHFPEESDDTAGYAVEEETAETSSPGRLAASRDG